MESKERKDVFLCLSHGWAKHAWNCLFARGNRCIILLTLWSLHDTISSYNCVQEAVTCVGDGAGVHCTTSHDVVLTVRRAQKGDACRGDERWDMCTTSLMQTGIFLSQSISGTTTSSPHSGCGRHACLWI